MTVKSMTTDFFVYVNAVTGTFLSECGECHLSCETRTLDDAMKAQKEHLRVDHGAITVSEPMVHGSARLN